MPRQPQLKIAAESFGHDHAPAVERLDRYRSIPRELPPFRVEKHASSSRPRRLKGKDGAGRWLRQPQLNHAGCDILCFQREPRGPVDYVTLCLGSCGPNRDALRAFEPFYRERHAFGGLFAQIDTRGKRKTNKPKACQGFIVSYPLDELTEQNPAARASELVSRESKHPGHTELPVKGHVSSVNRRALLKTPSGKSPAQRDQSGFS